MAERCNINENIVQICSYIKHIYMPLKSIDMLVRMFRDMGFITWEELNGRGVRGIYKYVYKY